MSRWRLAIGAMLAFAAAAGADVPPERLDRLARGVNLSHWLWLPQGKTGADRDAWFTAADARQLRAVGLTHVRLPFEPERVWNRAKSILVDEGYQELERAIARCVDAGLAVVVDAHPGGAEWNVPEAGTGRFVALEAMWPALAARLAGTDPDRVFLEVLNEPHDLKDSSVWPAAQERLIAAIRAAAPRHTIMATGDGWGSIDGLLRLKPVPDDNVVYSFHFYEPHDFTHQGATWGAAHWKHLKGLPYPSSAEAVGEVAAGITDEQAARVARAYGRQRWDAVKIRVRINQAAAWGRDHHVPVYCGEFGAFKEFSPRESRLAWLRDTRAAIEASKLGWAMWDYAGGFALMEGAAGVRQPDDGVREGLGLQPIP